MREYVPQPQRIHSISELVTSHERLLSSSQTWVFRGEGFRQPTGGEWTLQPSLERAVRRFGPLKDAPHFEYWVYREFRRRYHHYDPSAPESWDTIEWLSLMQHHGAPTRLLDWTYSPFVAAFFALQEASSSSEAIVWCCNVDWLREKALALLKTARARLPKDRKDPFRQDGTAATARFFNRQFCIQDENPPKPKAQFVYPLNSFRLNQRLTIQQGVFLCPSDVSLPFHTNLSLMNPGTEGFRLWILDKQKDPGNHRKMLTQLARMNLTEAVLFPGLDGFSRSLKLNWRLIGR